MPDVFDTLDEQTDIFDEVARRQFGQPSSPLDPTLSDAERAAVSSPFEPGNMGSAGELPAPLLQMPGFERRALVNERNALAQNGPGITEPGSVLSKLQLGAAKGMAGVGSGMSAAVAGATTPLIPLPGIDRKVSIADIITGGTAALPEMLGAPNSVDALGLTLPLTQEGVRQQFQGGADVATEAQKNVGVVDRSTAGPQVASTLAEGATSLVPTVASGGLGLAGMVAAAGLQSFGGTYQEAQKAWQEQGFTPEQAREKAVVDGMISGTITAGVTAVGGKTGVEAFNNPASREALKGTITQMLGQAAKTLGKEASKEALEEGSDQLLQNIQAKLRYNPKLTLEDAVKDVVTASALGGVLGGAANVPRLGLDLAGVVGEKAEAMGLARKVANASTGQEFVELTGKKYSQTAEKVGGGITSQAELEELVAAHKKTREEAPAIMKAMREAIKGGDMEAANSASGMLSRPTFFSQAIQYATGQSQGGNVGVNPNVRFEGWRFNPDTSELSKPTSAPKAASAEAETKPAATATDSSGLEAVYKIFEPAPKQRPSVSSVLKGVGESVRTGLSSKFRPLDKLAEDISAAYGSTVKRIAGTFEALKGSTGRSEAEVYRFDNDVSRAVKGKEKDFNAYMFLKRSLDRLNMDAADISTALAGGEVKKLNRRAVAGYTIPQLESNLAALEAKLGPEVKSTFEKAADQYQQHMDKALRWQVESGRMSAEVYDSIKAGNQFYAPFKVLKYLEESNRPAGTGKRIDTPAEYTKAMEGIEDPNFKLGDMLAAGRMGLRVSRILSDKHAAMRTMADLAPFDVEGRFIQRLKEGAEAPAGSEAVNVFENGKQIRYAVPKEVAEAVQLFDTRGTGLVETIFRGGAVPFRAGATAWNIPFQVSNLMADIPRSVLVARTGFRGNPVDIVRLPFDYVHSVYASIMGDVVSPLTGIKPPKLFLDFLDSGAAGTTMQEAFTPGALRFHQSSRLAQGTKLGKSVLRTIPQIATAIEQSTKIFGVKRAMRMSGQESGEALYKNGKDLLTEVRRFSGSPDFGRIGKWTDAYRLNVMVPFLNARIQGTVADLGRLSGRDGAKTAAATWTKLGLAIGVPTAALYALNNGDEYAEDYTKIPEKEKQNYWHIPKDSFVTLDSGEKIRDYWRIPKRESSKWVANLTESSLDFAKKQNPEQAGRWLKSLVEDISPVNIQGETAQERGESAVSGLNPLLKAPLEVVTGRDLYRHRDVVPQSMQKASPGNQFTDRTPEAFKRLAEAMPDITPEVLRSPIMLENMTRNLTAGLFTQFLPGRPVEGRTEFENNPLLKRFQAALYTDERELRQEIQSLQREAADTYLERNRAAEKILKDSKGAPLKDVLLSAAKSPGADLRLLQHTVDLYVAEKAGITGPERQLLALPVQQRAQFITRKLEDATPETKREIFLNFARKRILTEAVAEEIVKEMEPKK